MLLGLGLLWLGLVLFWLGLVLFWLGLVLFWLDLGLIWLGLVLFWSGLVSFWLGFGFNLVRFGYILLKQLIQATLADSKIKLNYIFIFHFVFSPHVCLDKKANTACQLKAPTIYILYVCCHG